MFNRVGLLVEMSVSLESSFGLVASMGSLAIEDSCIVDLAPKSCTVSSMGCHAGHQCLCLATRNHGSVYIDFRSMGKFLQGPCFVAGLECSFCFLRDCVRVGTLIFPVSFLVSAIIVADSINAAAIVTT